tara:strand:+ start:4210 stop:5181 length:972 start_codon:yes stop_codon:yes gene_type:complete
MKDLQKKYLDKYAILLLGGNSCLQNLYKLKFINKKKFVIFVETKSLTNYFYNLQIQPDYLLATFPEKLKDNSLHNFIFRSFLQKSIIKPFLNQKYHEVYDFMKINFNKYFENFNLQKGPHKRYKYKENVYLKDSPMDILKKYPNLSIITNFERFKFHFPNLEFNNKFFYISQNNENLKNFNLENYFNPCLELNNLKIGYAPFLNSSAINIYPILNFMGFKKIFFLGMDMNMLGSMEYSANNVFKNMLYFKYYIYRNRKSFNANYKINIPYYYRPQSEFDDLKLLNKNNYIEFTRITNNNKYEAKIDYIKSIDESIFYDKYSVY